MTIYKIVKQNYFDLNKVDSVVGVFDTFKEAQVKILELYREDPDDTELYLAIEEDECGYFNVKGHIGAIREDGQVIVDNEKKGYYKYTQEDFATYDCGNLYEYLCARHGEENITFHKKI